MDDDGNVLEWLIDTGAAALFASAAAWSVAMLGGPLAATVGAAVALAASLGLLRQAGKGSQRFRLGPIQPVAWSDALVPATASNIVPLLLDRPLPTPGEMQGRIDRHLAAGERVSSTEGEGSDVILLGADASAALRRALGELKRSVR